MKNDVFDFTSWPPQVQALLDAAPDGMLVVDRDGKLLLANAQVEVLFGYPRDELIGAPVELLVPTRFRDAHPSHRERYASEPRTRPMGVGLDLCGRRKDGSEFPAEISLSPLRLGTTTVTIAAIRDVTARKNAEAQFRGLLEAAPDAMVIANAAGTITLVNAQAERLFGYPREEMLGHPVEMLVPDDSRGAHHLHRERYMHEPRTRPMGAGLELHARRKDGTKFPAEISLSPLQTPDGTFVTAAIRDVSERKKAEAAQRALVSEASALLSSALDTAAVCDGVARLAVLHVAEACEVTLVGPNRDLERIAFARRSDRERGATAAPSHTSAAVQAAVARAMENRRPERVDDGDGGPPSTFTLVVPLVARAEAIGALVMASARPHGPGDLAIAEDLAHRTAIAVDNARLYREAREANAAKDRFLALLGHELRNPLGAASSALQVIERVRRWDDRLERHIGIVERQVRQLTRLVEDLLDVSRITAGKVTLRREMVDLRDVARKSVESHSLEAAARKQEIMLSSAGSPVWVEGDAARLEQILNNLLVNAIKYTQQGGSIWVEVRRQGKEAVLRVQDDGAGIEPQLLPRIFDLFIQGDQSLEHAHGGLGLGLPVVRHLVELHGGHVSARSGGVHQGSEFVVRLPLFWEGQQATPPPGRHAPAGPPQGGPGSHHLLIVEDNPDARQSLQELLQMNGHRVEVAEDGQQGLDVALARRPEAAFVDIGLPLLDGYEVARRLRAHFGARGIRLIALTGYGQPEDRDRALAAGFDVHLVKPIDLETVNQVLAPLGDPAAIPPPGKSA